LTVERTAGATALALEHLAAPDARRLAIVGTGAVGRAHLRHIAPLRAWESIRVFSPGLGAHAQNATNGGSAAQRAAVAALAALDPRVSVSATLEDCVRDADVVALCTSSGQPVLANGMLTKPALITSISTNVANAHEVPPAWLPDMDVYCDYRRTTPASAGEMKLAAELHGWSAQKVVADLPELVSTDAQRPSYRRHALFRSIGLGLEDVAIAYELFRYLNARNSVAK
jgi:L-arginine dehydrogenase